MERKPRILIYDIETTPILAWVYDEWNTNVVRVEEYAYMMCFSYKWLGENKVYNVALPDFGVRYKADPQDDQDVARALWHLFEEADIVVAHNANRFDNRVATARFVVHNLGPPAPYKTVDTLLVARRYTKFSSNALDKLGRQLEIGRKTKSTHGQLWYDCIDPNLVAAKKELAWRKMVRYNNQDVRVLERLYKRYLPYITNHPNLAVISQIPHSCPNCGGTRIIRKGFRTTNVRTYARFLCKNCGHWMSDRTSDTEMEVPDFTNFNG